MFKFDEIYQSQSDTSFFTLVGNKNYIEYLKNKVYNVRVAL